MAPTRQLGEIGARAPGSPRKRMRFLVAYASAHGATEGVAERIASCLAAGGDPVDLGALSDAPSPAGYDAVILGSPVYDQRWLPEATAFVRLHEAALADRPLWIFSVGSLGDRHPLVGRLVKREPKGIGELCATLHARDYRMFAGVIRREQWPLPSRAFFHLLGGRIGDRRDWSDIEAWADGIAHSLGVTRPSNPT